jgi:hypothetical protein
MLPHERFKQVVSTDGTQIAFERRQQPPLVLVRHGTDHTLTPPFPNSNGTSPCTRLPARMASGEVFPYAIEREFEDVAALVDSIPDGMPVRAFLRALCSWKALLHEHPQAGA